MSCMRVYEEHADKAGMDQDQASFQVVDRRSDDKGDANFLKLSEVALFSQIRTESSRTVPLKADELIFAQIFSVPVFTGAQAQGLTEGVTCSNVLDSAAVRVRNPTIFHA